MKGNTSQYHHKGTLATRSSNKESGDEQICTSADKVGSIDNLLIEILLWLPLISLRLFKSVSKRWLFLITGRNFILLRSKNPNFDHPFGLLLQASSVFTFLPLHTTNLVKKLPLITSSFSFDVNSGDIEVLQSCNGLRLCSGWPDKFYVYNPTTNVYKLLALPHDHESDRFISGMAIAFDPAVSPHYKVLYPLHYANPEIPVQIGFYSSETDNWSICAQTFGSESFGAFEKGVYWNDAIHWIDYSGEVFHFHLDTENPHFIEVETPGTLDEEAYEDDILSVSCDCLLLLQTVQPRFSLQMNLYEMKNDYSGWFFKYHVNLNHITTEDFNFMPDDPYFFVLSIVSGNRDEEPFLMLEVPEKRIQYNIISQTFHELGDLQPNHYPGTTFSSFLFTPSLAGV